VRHDKLIVCTYFSILFNIIPISNYLNRPVCYFSDKIKLIRNVLDSNSIGSAPTNPSFSGSVFDNFDAVNASDVQKVLYEMSKKSCPLDPLPFDVMFSCLDELVPAITDIMNISLSSGVVPACYKHALVIPLLKKSNLDHNVLKNYRPVSNLPFLSKVLERIVLKQLMGHLERHKLLEPFQSAYRKCHSTETALLRVTNDILLASDHGEISILSLLDLSAAFDTIDHVILCNRLSTMFGCSGLVLDWFNSYLSGRSQSVIINNIRSEPTLVMFGVPQGSVLGPVLFSMYMAPLGDTVKPFDVLYHFFADDSQLHASALPRDAQEMATNLAKCINKVATWMSTNKLKMNDDKTEVIAIGTKLKINSCSIKEISFNNCTIKFSDSAVRNLGVYIDPYLSLETHVNNLCRSLYVQLRRIGKIRKYLTIQAANKLAVAFILSRLDYCNSLLAGLPDEKIYKLQRIQNSAARMVLRKSKYSSASSLLRELHWLPVKARIDYKIASLCFKCRINNLEMPSYLCDLLIPYTPSRNLRSQDAALFHVPRFKLNSWGKRAFSIYAPSLWNSLPLSLRQCSSLCSFKKHLKTHLFNIYL